MINKLKHIILPLLAIILLVLIATPSYAEEVSCPGALTAADTKVTSVTDIDSQGLFSNEILGKMKFLMTDVYKTMAQTLMFGHSLVCYSMTPKLGAQDLDLVNIFGWKAVSVTIWDFSMMLCGFIIYAVGLLMSIAIGMYFIDISFKLGFAVLFIPVSIALWPFKPTSQKFTENLFIIVRNSMLFTFAAIIVAFATELIAQGIGLDEYWVLVDQGETAAHQVKDLYSLATIKFLIIAFCLIFSFKILSSGIEKYLDAFFKDPVFGSESPMHHMGTQAVGMATDMTLKPGLSYAKDVASNMAGKAMTGIGNGIERMRHGDFSDFQRIGDAVKATGSIIAHPSRSFKRGVTAVSDKAADAIGDIAKDLNDWKNILKPGTFYEQEYLEKQESFNAKVDKKVDSTKEKITEFVNQGADEALKDAISGGAAAAINGAQIMSGTATPESMVTSGQMREKLHEAKETFKEGTKDAIAATISKAGKMAAVLQGQNPDEMASTQEVRQMLHGGRQRAQEFLNKTKEKLKTTQEQLADKTQQLTNKLDENTQGLQKGVKEFGAKAKEFGQEISPDKTSISLQPSVLISAPFKLVGNVGRGVGDTAKNVGNTIKTLVKLQIKGAAQQNQEQAVKQIWQNSDLYKAGQKTVEAAKNVSESAHNFANQVNSVEGGAGAKALEGGKIIAKKGGQIVVRTAKGTVQDTMGVLSRVFIGFGKELSDNSKNSNRNYRKEREDRKKREAAEQQEESLFRRSLADKYDE